MRVIAIHPGRALLGGSSDLPGSLNGAGHSSSPIWSCSAWGLPCQPDYFGRGALLPHLFTLTGQPFEGLSGGIFSVALSVKTPLRDPPRPLAGTLPCGDRTFLSFRRTSGYPSNACPVQCRTGEEAGALRQVPRPHINQTLAIVRNRRLPDRRLFRRNLPLLSRAHDGNLCSVAFSQPPTAR